MKILETFFFMVIRSLFQKALWGLTHTEGHEKPPQHEMAAVTGKAQGTGVGSGAEFVSTHHETNPEGVVMTVPMLGCSLTSAGWFCLVYMECFFGKVIYFFYINLKLPLQQWIHSGIVKCVSDHFQIYQHPEV